MISKINISQIIVDKKNRRQVNQKQVEALAESIKTIGLLNPITMNNNNELLAGLHRLEACKLLGYMQIEANCIGGGYLEYQLAEIDENLIRNELSVLERGENLEKRKLIYEELYPETKKGIAGGIASGISRGTKTENDFVQKDSFVESTSKLTGESESTIKDNIRISKNITDEVKEIIRNEPIADKKTELLNLAKQEPETQLEIAKQIVNKEISRVNDYSPKTDKPIETKQIIETIPTKIDTDVIDLKNDIYNVINAYNNSKSPKCLEMIKRFKEYLKAN